MDLNRSNRPIRRISNCEFRIANLLIWKRFLNPQSAIRNPKSPSKRNRALQPSLDLFFVFFTISGGLGGRGDQAHLLEPANYSRSALLRRFVVSLDNDFSRQAVLHKGHQHP